MLGLDSLHLLGDGSWLVWDDDVLELVLGDGADCECVWRKELASIYIRLQSRLH